MEPLNPSKVSQFDLVNTGNTIANAIDRLEKLAPNDVLVDTSILLQICYKNIKRLLEAEIQNDVNNSQ